MRTASIQELPHDTESLLGLLAKGEEIGITYDLQVVARLVPEPRRRIPQPTELPDFIGRMRRIYGDYVMSEEEADAILDENKGPW